MPSKPVILAFDTSAAQCAAALLCEGKIIAHHHEDMSKGQAERLFPLLEDLLREAQLTWRDLSALAVGIGPGNFTGIRISVSAARGLALSLNIPAIGVSSLEAQVFNETRPIWGLLDARRDQIFAQYFEETEGAIFQKNAPMLITKEDIPTLDGKTIGPDLKPESAKTIARIAAQKLSASQDATNTASIPSPAPLYVRAADAAPPRDPAPVILP